MIKLYEIFVFTLGHKKQHDHHTVRSLIQVHWGILMVQEEPPVFWERYRHSFIHSFKIVS